ncbi:hypothetical protein Gasu2_46400 [Galdieria sulphuraria]|uniref:Uncharacterized protein n=1 Tax=Galdieria sulphuraria TaxID=130081 RepID=M2Y6J9_GALSU|nr:uncharacterized protein Gasu_10410 [Galdieria sulphuraria]EME31658.1 hypothetical protein Gasu_10410 [Galdieria sulphuraria]GJD10451.1 hypothetical protein Gasu2_46400 [Galdieria sulphuraria]|eukprot:XP_005708178.1 hypothetical protein Gasu_10410 [Galdieria sulphuraria]
MPPKNKQNRNCQGDKIYPLSKNTIDRILSPSKTLYKPKKQAKNAISSKDLETQTATACFRSVKKTSFSKLNGKEKYTNVQNTWQFNGSQVKTSYDVVNYQMNRNSSSRQVRNEKRVYNLNIGKYGGTKLEKTQHETEEMQEMVCYR